MKYTELSLPQKNDTVVVGLSGGVDSTVTALRLQEAGCNVIGVTMALWKGDLPELPNGKKLKSSCYGPDETEDIAACEKFCAMQKIPYHVIDVKEQYQKLVLDYFKAEYRAGRTPNPCIRCNSFIKFGALLDGVQKLGITFDYFCTGHYAKMVQPETPLWESDKKPAMIATASDSTKDQTYFLYRIDSHTLEKVRFPLSRLEKKEVFAFAKNRNLFCAEKSESQDFIPSEYFDLLFQDKKSIAGDIIDLDGHVLGKHRGIEHYTIGQRRGLGVSSSMPLYVHSIDAKQNLIVLAKESELDSNELIVDDTVWPANVKPNAPFDAMVKIRLASKPVKARIEKYDAKNSENFLGDAYRVLFYENVRAASPGQSAVFYIDDVIVGGGIISRVVQ